CGHFDLIPLSFLDQLLYSSKMVLKRRKITKVDEAIAQVAEWKAYHERLQLAAREARERTGEVEHHRKRRECQTMLEFLEGLLQKQRGIGFELLPEDLEGLPPELKAELSITDSDQQELDILKLTEA